LFGRTVVDHLKRRTNPRSGAVNSWIHEKCEDVPLPYRWEIKENTHIFCNWLAHFIPETTWDGPHYFQMTRWRAP
jgi:hypothetical protein